jgi:hypothetical protein
MLLTGPTRSLVRLRTSLIIEVWIMVWIAAADQAPVSARSFVTTCRARPQEG